MNINFVSLSYTLEVPNNIEKVILNHYVCNAHFHWLWRRKFAALKSKRFCHESSDDVTSLATRRINITEKFWNAFYQNELEWW